MAGMDGTGRDRNGMAGKEGRGMDRTGMSGKQQAPSECLTPRRGTKERQWISSSKSTATAAAGSSR